MHTCFIDHFLAETLLIARSSLATSERNVAYLYDLRNCVLHLTTFQSKILRVFVKTVVTLSTRCDLANDFSLLGTSAFWCKLVNVCCSETKQGKSFKFVLYMHVSNKL